MLEKGTRFCDVSGSARGEREDFSSAAGGHNRGAAPPPRVGPPAALNIPGIGADATRAAPCESATTVAPIPAEMPYLHPAAELVERWANVVRQAAGGQNGVPPMRIGVCWRGDQQRVRMRDRSFDPAFLSPLASLPGVVLVSLQHGEAAPATPHIVTLSGLEPDKMRLLDVAAVMKSLGLVVTCDTSIAHLAGALGVPVWVALKSSACWRWMLDRNDSPWYPSMRLFRQDKPGDWAGVFGRMAEALKARLGASYVGSAPRTDSPTPQITVRSADPAQASCSIGVLACVPDAKTQPERLCYEAGEPVRRADFGRMAEAIKARLDVDPTHASPTPQTTVRSADPTRITPAGLDPASAESRCSELATDHPPLTTASPFNYFGTAYVLNLDGDADRMSRTSARLERLGIAYERFAALPAPPGLRPREPNRHAGAYGCAAFHRAILQRALELDRDRVMIFEDDVVLRDDAGEWLERIVPQLRLVDWDVFYLGLHLELPGPRRGDNLLAVARGYHTHAYAVAGKAIGRLIAHIDRILEAAAGTFDGMEDPSLLKVCAEPILAVQEPNFSRTVGRHMDRAHQHPTRMAFAGEIGSV
jgi:hypothetical protein